MTLDGEARIDAARSMEIGVQPNLFVRFVQDKESALLRYRDLTRQQRQLEAEGRTNFAPILSEMSATLKVTRGSSPKSIRQAEATYLNATFDTASVLALANRINKPPNEREKVFRDKVEAEIEKRDGSSVDMAIREARSQGVKTGGKADMARSFYARMGNGTRAQLEEEALKLAAFQESYALQVAPVIREARHLRTELVSDFTDYMQSSYGAVVDFANFLGNPSYSSYRDTAHAFLRDYIADDSEKRRANGVTSPTAGIRKYWQENLRYLFDPVLFDSFWAELDRLPIKAELLGWARYSAIAGQLDKDEASGRKIEEPTLGEIKRQAGLVPFEYWPPSLKEAYGAFAQREVSSVIESARVKMQQLFPPKSEIYIREQKGEEVEEGEIQSEGAILKANDDLATDLPEDQPPVEMRGRKYMLGIAKKFVQEQNPRSRNWRPVSPLSIEIVGEDDYSKAEAMSRLTKKIKSHRIREDMAEAVRLLLENPFRKGTIKMEGRQFQKNMPWREADPVGMGVRARDAETWRWRIIYIIDEEMVGIRAIVHHSVVDKFSGARMSIL